MIDLVLLRMLSKRDEFYKLRNRLPKGVLNNQTSVVLDDYADYYTKFTDHEYIDIEHFSTLFRARHSTLTDEQLGAYQSIISKIRDPVSEEDTRGVMETFLELRLAADVLKIVTDYEAGDVSNLMGEVSAAVDTFKKDARIKTVDFIRDNISDLLQEELDNSGMQWRLAALNESMRGLRSGDFGIVAGRPDKGKTTFLASEITHMASQLPPDKTVVWLNNEGPGRKIITRLYQATLGLKISGLVDLNKEGKLEEAYKDALGAPWRIRVFDIHGLDIYAVERIIENHSPGLVVYDMIDNIRGFNDAARSDQTLEKMYQWARELAVKHEFVGIATSQISQDGDGLQFPGLPMLKDSKTGKQGACDFQLMIGASNDPGLASVRYLGTPKNKLRREGGLADPRATVHYRPEIARYEDIIQTNEGNTNNE